MNKQLQLLADEFNKEYAHACNTASVEDWFKVALLGRQFVREAGIIGLISDTLPSTLIQINGEGHNAKASSN